MNQNTYSRSPVGTTVTALLLATALFVSTAPLGAQEPSFLRGAPLPIPPILEGTRGSDDRHLYDLSVQSGTREFIAGATTQTLGYNGDYLGPTIRVRRGEATEIRVRNTLKEATTVHWHGTHIPAEADGGPHQRVEANGRWTAAFTVDQEAATLWYHPHLMGTTAKQVYEGLAGFLIVDDEVSDDLRLPKEYGVNDIPLALQERRFNRDGTFAYRPTMPDIMHGYFGNALLANGVIEPTLQVGGAILRLRLLNGSNSTLLRLSLSNGEPLHQIATDGGLLEAPVTKDFVVLSPGERAEVLIDFSRMPQGLFGRRPVELLAETNGNERYMALRMEPGRTLSGGPDSIPSSLRARSGVALPESPRVRSFVMSTMGPGGRLTINGKLMDLSRIDEYVELGTTEVWEIVNRPMGNVPHSFHVHGLQFEILTINGSPPPPELAGPKDTVLLWPGDRVQIALAFTDYTGIYMYHCHLLEHEDEGMMGQYEVVNRN
jgi:blue copper oxidase